MLMEGRPAMEEIKATRKIVRLTIRHSMRIVCLQIDDIRLPQIRRNKSHPHIRFCGLLVSENITRPCFIERPNSNLTIPSGFFLFHRGLPFFKRGQSNKLHWSIRNVSVRMIHVKPFTSPKPFCVKALVQRRIRRSSRNEVCQRVC